MSDQPSFASTDKSKSFVDAEGTPSHSRRDNQCLESQTDRTSSFLNDSAFPLLTANHAQGFVLPTSTSIANVQTDNIYQGASTSRENNSHGTKRKFYEDNEDEFVDIEFDSELSYSDDNESCSIDCDTESEDTQSEPSQSDSGDPGTNIDLLDIQRDSDNASNVDSDTDGSHNDADDEASSESDYNIDLDN